MFRTILLVFPLALSLSTVFAQAQPKVDENVTSAQAHLQRGELDAALEDVARALLVDPNNVTALFIRSSVRLVRGQGAEALADCNRIIQLAPNARGIETVYGNRAVLRLGSGDVAAAISDLDKAISLNPKMASAYSTRAVARSQLGNDAGALSDYEMAISLDPNMTPALIGRAYYRWQSVDYDGALVDYERILRLQPEYGLMFVDRGIVHGLKGDIVKALDDLTKGAGLDPRAIADASPGKFDSPFKDLERFIRSHPTNARAYEVRGVFRWLQNNGVESQLDLDKCVEMDPRLKPEIAIIRNRLTKLSVAPK